MMLSAKKGLVTMVGSALLIGFTTGATSNGQLGNDAHASHSQHRTSSQCSKPMSERVGGWICPGVLSSRDMAPAASGHCKPHQSWCWTLDPQAGRSTWMGSFKYGLGRTNLGVVEVFFLVALSGRRSLSKPVRFVPTGAVRHVIMEGDRLL